MTNLNANDLAAISEALESLEVIAAKNGVRVQGTLWDIESDSQLGTLDYDDGRITLER